MIRYYNILEAAAAIPMHPESLRRLCRQGKVNFGRVGKKYMFTEAQIQAYVAANGSAVERRKHLARFEKKLAAGVPA